jgi:hypothetical protein
MKTIPRSFFLFIVVAMVSAALPYSARAGRYELIKGKGVEVCEAYQENLNSRNPNILILGNRSVNTKLKGFENQPVWENKLLDLYDNGVMEKVDRFLWGRDANPVQYFPYTEWKNWRGTPEQYRRAREHYQIVRDRCSSSRGKWVSILDIDNDGKPENVLLDQNCEGALVLVLNQDITDIDVEKTKLTLAHPSRKEAGWKEFRKLTPKELAQAMPEIIKEFGSESVQDALHHAWYDVFLYNKKAYFDLWWTDHPEYQGKPDNEVGRLRVFTIENKQRQEVCTYRFNQD